MINLQGRESMFTCGCAVLCLFGYTQEGKTPSTIARYSEDISLHHMLGFDEKPSIRATGGCSGALTSDLC